MAKLVDKLSPLACKNVGPGKHFDGSGLYLEVTPQGGRYWRMKYRHGGRESRLSFGTFPEITLAQARAARDLARSKLRQGVNPGEDKKVRKAEQIAASEQAKRGLVSTVTAEWLAFKRSGWADETRRKAEYVTETYLLPKLGNFNIATLASKDVAPVLAELAAVAPNLARKARQYVGGIVRYAQLHGLRDEARALPLAEAIPKFNKGNIPAATVPDDIARLLRAIHAYPNAVTRAALLWCAYTAQRPGVVAALRWDEIKDEEWYIPGSKMKMRHAHVVSLPRQALTVLEEMRAFTAGREYVFPALARQKTPHLHRDALSKALRSMGFAGQHATHGFRGMLRTAARERLGIAVDVLEAQLAHAKKGDVEKAYDRTTFDGERRKAMQQWADYLDSLRIEIGIHRSA